MSAQELLTLLIPKKPFGAGGVNRDEQKLSSFSSFVSTLLTQLGFVFPNYFLHTGWKETYLYEKDSRIYKTLGDFIDLNGMLWTESVREGSEFIHNIVRIAYDTRLVILKIDEKYASDENNFINWVYANKESKEEKKNEIFVDVKRKTWIPTKDNLKENSERYGPNPTEEDAIPSRDKIYGRTHALNDSNVPDCYVIFKEAFEKSGLKYIGYIDLKYVDTDDTEIKIEYSNDALIKNTIELFLSSNKTKCNTIKKNTRKIWKKKPRYIRRKNIRYVWKKKE